ncbi:MAG: ABC transporter substrate-binding protein [Ignisphaera sp.]
MKIVSLSPAVSETLSILGLEDNIVGITPWCRMYLKDENKPIVGTYLDVDIELLKKINPDIVFLQSHVHDEIFHKLRNRNINAHLLPLPTNLLDIISNVEFIASLTNRYWEGKELADKLIEMVMSIRKRSIDERPRVYVEFLWPDKTFTTSGCLTYIDDGVRIAGGMNIFFNKVAKFFHPKDEEIVSLDPQIVLVNIEPEFRDMNLDKYISIRKSLKNTSAFRTNNIFLIIESLEHNLAHPGPSFIINTLPKILQIISSYRSRIDI